MLSTRMMINVGTGLAAAGAPVGYIVAKHIQWERSDNSKKRMAVHQGVFWSTFFLGLYLIHKSFRVKAEPLMTRIFAKWGYLGTAGILPILGFEWGGNLGMKLYPKPQKPLKLYQPSYLKKQVVESKFS